MANFIVRIELYNADYDDYETLHKRMEGIKFYRYIMFPNGKNHDLPNGTYFGKCDLTTYQLLSEVKRVAKPLSKSKDPSIFLCSFNDWDASLYLSK
ncbi:TPA: DUF2622 domain-containing protein [Proteus mirabilis]|uniref:DUF2622 domain-containing protein n=1 Tax=Proteus mirabilis TaxID=584 RepID=UPI0022943D75|nr:DUF2622 domain-containing protein [Proteus mirabilis]HCU0048692.1 DUF2622 domain-containing protein [Proteus mirabilis]HEJ9800037.1 DUF2622 domain-containing protein [Proteus mirabilis]